MVTIHIPYDKVVNLGHILDSLLLLSKNDKGLYVSEFRDIILNEDDINTVKNIIKQLNERNP